MDELFGGWLGAPLGEWLRARMFERRYRRARSGRDVKVGALSHFAKAPEWRDMRGVLRRRKSAVFWQPGISARLTCFTVVPPRWWRVRRVPLDTARCIGTIRRSSAAHGDRVLINLAGVSEVTYVAVRPEGVRIAEVLLGLQ